MITIAKIISSLTQIELALSRPCCSGEATSIADSARIFRGRVSKESAYSPLANGPNPHLECGENLLMGWLNADFFSGNLAVVHIDLTGLFPLFRRILRPGV